MNPAVSFGDDRCVAFLAATPVRPGHTLVVPIKEVDERLDLDGTTAQHLMSVAQRIGRAQKVAFQPHRVGLMTAGFDVPHVHVHVVPLESPYDFDYSAQVPDPPIEDLDLACDRLRAAIGYDRT